MVRIEVSDKAARALLEARGSIEVFDEHGRRIGVIPRPVTNEEIDEARRRANEEPDGASLDEVWKRIKAGEQPS